MMNAADLQAPAEVRAANRARSGGRFDDECFVCARGMTAARIAKAAMVHLLTDGTIAPTADPIDDSTSQGFFPVGSECARKIPAAFRFDR